MDMIADDLEYLPASYNGNVWLGKEEFRQVVQYFIDTFDDIIFTEGLGRTREESCGFFGGSAYPADADPSEISVVGTWTPTHRETGKKSTTSTSAYCDSTKLEKSTTVLNSSTPVASKLSWKQRISGRRRFSITEFGLRHSFA